MRSVILLLAATALGASPAVAQHAGHNTPGMIMPMPAKPTAKKAPAKKPAAKKTPAKKPVTKKPPAEPEEHTGHNMPVIPPDERPDTHATHQLPTGEQSGAAGAHAGHDMSAMPDMEGHAGRDMGQMVETGPRPAPPPPEALSGPEWAADAYWPGQAQSRAILTAEHGTARVSRFLVDRAETRFSDGPDGYLVDIQAWYGGDFNKLWLKGEYEGSWGEKFEYAETQALWSHAIGPWVDLQAGARFDAQTGPNRGHLVLGIEGLVPYWWEVEGAVFLSNKGDLTARAEGEYDLRITQKLILQPRAEVNLSAQDIPELRIGAGLSDAELGLRLRYQLSPLFAPYVGVEYERKFGDTRDFRRAAGDDPDGWNLLAGIRLWF